MSDATDNKSNSKDKYCQNKKKNKAFCKIKNPKTNSQSNNRSKKMRCAANLKLFVK